MRLTTKQSHISLKLYQIVPLPDYIAITAPRLKPNSTLNPIKLLTIFQIINININASSHNNIKTNKAMPTLIQH